MKHKILTAALLLLTAAPLNAAQTNFDAGNVILPWMRADQDARTAAMGGAGRATASGAQATTHNPAGLAQSQNVELGFQHVVGIEDTNQQRAVLAAKFMGMGVGLGLDTYSFGTVPTYDVNGGILRQSGSIEPRGQAFSLGLGFNLPASLAAGLTMRIIQEDLSISKSNAVAITGGLQWRGKNLSLGLAATNFGYSIRGDLPSSIDAGLNYHLGLSDEMGLNFLAEASLPTYATDAAVYSGGVEFSLATHYLLRGGYRLASNSGISGASGGAGYRRGKLGLDYAFVMRDDLGNAHQVSLSVNF